MDTVQSNILYNENLIAQRLLKNILEVIDSSYDGIYITDGQANTLRINKAYERITGLNRDEMLGRNMRKLVKEGYISQSATLLVLETKKVTTIIQDFKTGRKALVTGTPIFDEEGNISMVVTNVRDVTELIYLRQELEEKKRLTKQYCLELENIKKKINHNQSTIIVDEKMLDLYQNAKRVSAVDTTVLLLGETGVGKEELAKYIQENSLRKGKPYLKINCGTIPPNLIEAELFGYEKGAFTGANSVGRAGLFEAANGGTLFLDEIGELNYDMQVKLLRVLQENEITRIGGIKPIKIDVRIITATNKDLEQMVKNLQFREDLYYRLNVVPFTIPPLRERREDIIPLIIHYLAEFKKKYNIDKYFDNQVLDYLYNYDWPGNVRELKNIVERLIIMCNNDKVYLEDLPKHLITSNSDVERDEDTTKILPLKDAVSRLEANLIDKAYKKHKKVREAASALGIDAATFVRKRDKYSSQGLLQK